MKPDTLSSASNQPTPQSPELDAEMHSLLQPETFPIEFWDNFMKGKIKRHISDSDAMNMAQKDTGYKYSDLDNLLQFNG